MPQVIKAHFVCDDDKNVKLLSDGLMWSGHWKVARQHWRTIQFLALHQRRAERSYRQGPVVEFRPSQAEPGRVEFKVKLTPNAVAWVGDGAGEKGYEWK